MVIHDKVVATNPAYTQKWLLHTPSRPDIAGLVPLRGSDAAGILQSHASRFSIHHERGRLDVATMLPRRSLRRLAGGKGYAYYVETDADESTLDGRNFADGAEEKPWFNLGRWRVEIQSATPAPTQHFLIALSPSLGEDRSGEVRPLEAISGELPGLATERSVILFAADSATDHFSFVLPSTQRRILFIGGPPGRDLTVASETARDTRRISGTGVLELPMPAGVEPGSRIDLTF